MTLKQQIYHTFSRLPIDISLFFRYSTDVLGKRARDNKNLHQGA